MPKNVRRVSEPIYEVEDQPKRRIFEHKPSETIKNDFLDHLKKTGKPHEWRWHTSTTPPKGATPEILTEFVVPERFRSSVLMAPCPICSPKHPKYWEGMLAWFKEERAIRAIGCECGHRFLGNFSEAIARYRRTQEQDQNFDFLMRNAFKIKQIDALARKLFPRARLTDKTKVLIRTVLSKSAVQNINRHMAGTGQLSWFEVVKAPVLDARGEMRFDRNGDVLRRDETVTTRRFEFLGLDALRQLDDFAEPRLITTVKLLEGLHIKNDDELLEICTAYQDNLEQLVFRIRRAWMFANEAIDQMKNLQIFLQPNTVQTLGEWGRDRSAVRRVKARYIRSGLLEIGEFDKKSRSIPIDESLLNDLPVIEPLD